MTDQPVVLTQAYPKKKSELGLVATILSGLTLILLIILFIGSLTVFSTMDRYIEREGSLEAAKEPLLLDYGEAFFLFGVYGSIAAILCVLASPLVSIAGIIMSIIGLRQKTLANEVWHSLGSY